ncbi:MULTISPECIES: hypothetical protein [unclassified Nodularia (in: cyanobacteria)]|uniref:hypothetical protein n=1 Tax=unclassified Nodularia (in: cyanobacteria) TaxID=2656917 RepID=UPI0018827F94|nr:MULTISPECIES: hypothetical protein [unclassified Nodularia (in: cyanobacteria)]MBE9197756.1 hypothetical protein [Nodularia sp. LEGE 06071]MCC2692602.1 hypothetical protein [Nodularia sp. LEGE 04288]
MNLPKEYLATLESIEPISVVEYLANNGWIEETKIDSRASIWTKTKNHKKFSILLPLDTNLPDFDDRIYEVFKTLEFFEQRPLSEIINVVRNVKDIAIEKQREILILKFKFLYEESKKQIPAKKIGTVLTSLQELFDAVGQSESGIISENGRIKKEITEKTEISVFETFQGSFGIKLALAPHPQQLNLLEPPLAERVTETFIQLIKFSNTVDKGMLKEYLNRLKKRSASRYRKFLMSLINSEANLYFNWGSVNPQKGDRAVLDFENVIATIDFINKMEVEEPSEYTINGQLIAANKNTNNLEIEAFEDQKRYIGKANSNIVNNKDVELTIGRLYSATIQEISSINPATGEEKTEYTIIDLLYWHR